jgi:hypothetical protein
MDAFDVARCAGGLVVYGTAAYWDVAKGTVRRAWWLLPFLLGIVVYAGEVEVGLRPWHEAEPWVVAASSFSVLAVATSVAIRGTSWFGLADGLALASVPILFPFQLGGWGPAAWVPMVVMGVAVGALVLLVVKKLRLGNAIPWLLPFFTGVSFWIAFR